ncbi:MAG: GAF domain-containing protein [Bdellovibrionota bacterium]
MESSPNISSVYRAGHLDAFFKELRQEAEGLWTGYWPSDMANLSALIYHNFPDINWCGFYILDPATQKLRLGPFQGKVACVEIPVGKGVCGHAVKTKLSVLVEDVHLFAGHIACDAASRSELVVPIGQGNIIGVLDIDSPLVNRFSIKDQLGFEALVNFDWKIN